MNETPDPYKDFYAWSPSVVERLKERRPLDDCLADIIEALESLGRHEVRPLCHRLEQRRVPLSP